MTDYTKLVKVLRCKRDDCEGCDLAFFDKDEGWMCRYAAKDDDAADAIEELQKTLKAVQKNSEINFRMWEEAQAEVERLQAQLPKRGEWELIDGVEPMRWGCSRCKYLSWETSNYCPRCGAKMFASDINVLNKNDTTDGPIITPCRGCSDYDGYGGCKSKGGCARTKMEVQDGK